MTTRDATAAKGRDEADDGDGTRRRKRLQTLFDVAAVTLLVTLTVATVGTVVGMWITDPAARRESEARCATIGARYVSSRQSYCVTPDGVMHVVPDAR